MLNMISLQGRFTNDVELKKTSNGVSVASFTLACERDYRDAETNMRESDFFDCVAWKGNAEFISAHYHKGDMVCINGRLQTRTYNDKEGNKRKVTEIIIENSYFAGKKTDRPEDKKELNVEEYMDMPDEIPFT